MHPIIVYAALSHVITDLAREPRSTQPTATDSAMSSRPAHRRWRVVAAAMRLSGFGGRPVATDGRP